jgi:hypothetical protein
MCNSDVLNRSTLTFSGSVDLTHEVTDNKSKNLLDQQYDRDAPFTQGVLTAYKFFTCYLGRSRLSCLTEEEETEERVRV